MPDENPKNTPNEKSNPYNIDMDRERRLKRMFQVWIAAGFIIAAALIAAGFAMDAFLAMEDEDGTSVTPYASPATQSAPPAASAAPGAPSSE
ncbi:MAG TPA: hypothetical protein PLJ47_10230 [Candidatus Hydrogenedentes bacterium]|nr:hypothetical protein [Candidatus Hydrogenedentota bacterium]